MFGKTFGAELEFESPRANRAEVAAALTAAGVSAFDAGYSHATSPRWKLVSDASVTSASANGHSMELVSPILEGETGLAMLRKACEVLTRLGCTTNRTCGLHVHVGARQMAIAAMRRLAILYSDFESVLDSMMPPSRRENNNTYLQSNVAGRRNNGSKADIARAADVRELARNINGGSRYAKLNFTSHWKHGTVEFRHHSGTVNADKACNWVVACIRMVVTAERDAVSAAPVVNVASRRPNVRAMGQIYDLVARPEGVTREEARVIMGRTSPPAINWLTHKYGIQLRRVGQRYFLAEQPQVNSGAATSAAADVLTLEGWIAKLGLSETEATYWKERQAFFTAAQQTAEDRVNWTPGSVMARRAGI